MKVRSVPSTLINQVGTLMIVFATESSYVEYQPGKAAAEDGTHMYYWDNTTTKASCPFEESISFGCDKWNLDGSVNYVCSHGRFAFESSGSIDVRNCPKARMSPEGIIYREEDTDMATLYTSQRIAMIPGNKFAGDLETVRTLTANGLAHLDADICSLECEIANLELRTSRHYSSLVRTGAGYVLVNPSGHAYDCSKVTQCSVIKPYTFCGSPPRIHIKCDGRDYYWSPEFSHIMTGDGCPSPMPEEQFKIHLGNHLYYLEDDMTIKVPANYTNSLRTRSYTLNKGSLIELEDLRELRASWKAYKTRGNLSYFLDSSTKISTHSLLNMQWIPDVGKFVDYVRNSFMTWERVCLISVIIVLSVYVSKPIIYYILNKKKVQVPRQVSYQRPAYQMEFI